MYEKPKRKGKMKENILKNLQKEKSRKERQVQCSVCAKKNIVQIFRKLCA